MTDKQTEAKTCNLRHAGDVLLGFQQLCRQHGREIIIGIK